MPTDSARCRALCELIDREPEDSPRAEIYVRLLWQILDKQLFPIPTTLRWRRTDSRVLAATA
jgi:hypothetical protein